MRFIEALEIPGLIVLPVTAGVGKTLVAGAIADWFRRQGLRVAVCVPVQTGAQHRREGLVSQEAEFLAVCANARHPLDLICPQRYAENYIPAIAARRADRPIDWGAIERSIRLMSQDADIIVIQSPATITTPMDDKHTVLDLITSLMAPVVLVTRGGLEAVNDVTLTAKVLRGANVPTAGFVVNRYPADSPSVDQELSLREIEKWSGCPLLCVIPEEKFTGPQLPGAMSGIVDLVDWRARSEQR